MNVKRLLAPSVFHPGILPARQFAGNVVNRSLGIMHWIGLVCGIVFAATSMIDARVVDGAAHPFALRNHMGFIDNVPHDDPRRVEFNRLHEWSTRVEGAVMLLGLVLVYVTARRIG